MTQNSNSDTDAEDGTLVVEAVEEIPLSSAEQTRLFAAAALLLSGAALVAALLALGIAVATRRGADL